VHALNIAAKRINAVPSPMSSVRAIFPRKLTELYLATETEKSYYSAGCIISRARNAILPVFPARI
jgi:hypothetical protein